MGPSEALWLDSDIIIDWLTQREPWHEAATELIQRSGTGEWVIYLSPLTLANVFYVHRKTVGTKSALSALRTLYNIGQIAAMDATQVNQALDSGRFDFEDELQIACADAVNVAAIITRNLADYRHVSRLVMTAEQWLQQHPLTTP